jgi:hypothetical protein
VESIRVKAMDQIRAKYDTKITTCILQTPPIVMELEFWRRFKRLCERRDRLPFAVRRWKEGEGATKSSAPTWRGNHTCSSRPPTITTILGHHRNVHNADNENRTINRPLYRCHRGISPASHWKTTSPTPSKTRFASKNSEPPDQIQQNGKRKTPIWR